MFSHTSLKGINALKMSYPSDIPSLGAYALVFLCFSSLHLGVACRSVSRRIRSVDAFEDYLSYIATSENMPTCRNGTRVCGGPGLGYASIYGADVSDEWCQQRCGLPNPTPDSCPCRLCACKAHCPAGTEQVISVDFDNLTAGYGSYRAQYTYDQMIADFGPENPKKPAQGNWSALQYTMGYNMTRGLKVVYNEACVGFKCTVRFRSQISPPLQEAYLGFFVRLSHNFVFVKGGKLAGGLCGGTCQTANGIPTGFDGFNSAYMWRQHGSAMNYLYYTDQEVKSNGEGENALANRTFIPGQWHHVLVRIRMNTPNETDGILDTWFDGDHVVSRPNMVWRRTDQFAIDQFMFTSFFGGIGQDWAPNQTVHAIYDNYMLCGNRVAPTLTLTPHA
eukprot:comp15040_c0_seq1/m.11661 comp15040_c0_seq1/g.11661  ORF comp15040_c0_seq1/g.11661 comp15040_c0_seq1/m.11661 type:complete len:391 (-) comp15040_c0_seq1:413-1585(-)